MLLLTESEKNRVIYLKFSPSINLRQEPLAEIVRPEYLVVNLGYAKIRTISSNML